MGTKRRNRVRKSQITMKDDFARILCVSAILGLAIIFFTLNSTILGGEDKDMIMPNVAGDDPPPGTNQSEESLPNSTSVTYDEEDCRTYLDSFDTIDILMALEPNLVYDSDEEDIDENDADYDENADDVEPEPELYEDNRHCTKYWSFLLNWGHLEVQVDANDLEITYLHNAIVEDGELSENDAYDLAVEFIEEFAPEIEETPDLFSTEEIVIDSGSGMDEEENVYNHEVTGYSYLFERVYEEIPTSDKIYVVIDSSGGLCCFAKSWNLEMPEDITPSVTEEEALTLAANYLNPNAYVTSELMIVRPTYYWDYGMRYGFSEGILSWIITEYEDEECSWAIASVFIDANTEEVIGGFGGDS